MKSLQIRHELPKTQERYGDLHVSYSSAGWFVGSSYRDPSKLELGAQPGTRDTDYFETPADATFALAVLERMYAELLRQHAHPLRQPDELTDKEFSADFSAVLNMCGLDKRGVGLRLEP